MRSSNEKRDVRYRPKADMSASDHGDLTLTRSRQDLGI